MKQDHVVSVRFDSALLAEAQRLAAADGRSLGNWIRSLVARETHRTAQPPEVPGLRAIGWQCPHLTMTSAPSVLGRVVTWCGCDMQPMYEQAA